MKAILLNNGNLDIIIANEGEISNLDSGRLIAFIRKADGSLTGTRLEMKYDKDLKNHGIELKSDGPLTKVETAYASIDTRIYTALKDMKNKPRPEKVIEDSSESKQIRIFGPGGYTRELPSEHHE